MKTFSIISDNFKFVRDCEEVEDIELLFDEVQDAIDDCDEVTGFEFAINGDTYAYTIKDGLIESTFNHIAYQELDAMLVTEDDAILDNLIEIEVGIETENLERRLNLPREDKESEIRGAYLDRFDLLTIYVLDFM